MQNQLYEHPYELPQAEREAKEKAYTDQANRAQQALHRLGTRCQRVLVLFYREQQPLAEIARLLGLDNVTMAKTLRYRCYQRWLKELRKLRNNE